MGFRDYPYFKLYFFRVPAENFSVNDREFLNKVIDLVHAQMASQNVNVKDLADRLNMTSRQLNQKSMQSQETTSQNIS